jgi:uncharacterized protein (TIGR02217 family)
MSDFHEVRFPEKISYGSTGGPMRRVDVVTLANGFEERNSPWAHARHKYNVGYGIRNLSQAYEVVEFFQAREGKLYGFRYKDWADYKSCPVHQVPTKDDQVLGTGNGTTTQFQLRKAYTDTGNTYYRIITKPVAGTVLVSLNGTLQTQGTHYTINNNTGVITFMTAPGNGVIVRAGFEFDVPVRFDTDWLPINLANYEAGEFSDIPLIEVRV